MTTRRSRAKHLFRWLRDEGWQETFNAYSRCNRIVRKLEPLALSTSDDPETTTQDLFSAYKSARQDIDTKGLAIESLLGGLGNLKAPIDRFFDEILVMANDPKLKDARLSLLQHIADLPNGIADLTRLEGF